MPFGRSLQFQASSQRVNPNRPCKREKKLCDRRSDAELAISHPQPWPSEDGLETATIEEVQVVDLISVANRRDSEVRGIDVVGLGSKRIMPVGAMTLL